MQPTLISWSRALLKEPPIKHFCPLKIDYLLHLFFTFVNEYLYIEKEREQFVWGSDGGKKHFECQPSKQYSLDGIIHAYTQSWCFQTKHLFASHLGNYLWERERAIHYKPVLDRKQREGLHSAALDSNPHDMETRIKTWVHSSLLRSLLHLRGFPSVFNFFFFFIFTHWSTPKRFLGFEMFFFCPSLDHTPR